MWAVQVLVVLKTSCCQMQHYCLFEMRPRSAFADDLFSIRCLFETWMSSGMKTRGDRPWMWVFFTVILWDAFSATCEWISETKAGGSVVLRKQSNWKLGRRGARTPTVAFLRKTNLMIDWHSPYRSVNKQVVICSLCFDQTNSSSALSGSADMDDGKPPQSSNYGLC